MVQAWSMPFQVPATGVLDPRPGVLANQAHFAGPPLHQFGAPPTSPPTDVWNNQALLAALATSGVPPSGPQAIEWFMDIGASSHMSSSSGNLSSLQPLSYSPPTMVGNGASLLVTHRASSTIATPNSSLHLNNVLVSPGLVKNLISVRSLTKDNNVSVEFDPSGFSIKDLRTWAVIL